MLKFLIIFILVVMLVRMLLRLFLPTIIRSMMQQMQARQAPPAEKNRRPEGSVHVSGRPKGSDKSIDNEGEYVDYEEIR
ncbi:MAG: DUF4834 family protein [Bacteroidia bacterium]|jgi:hypothetical protein